MKEAILDVLCSHKFLFLCLAFLTLLWQLCLQDKFGSRISA